MDQLFDFFLHGLFFCIHTVCDSFRGRIVGKKRKQLAYKPGSVLWRKFIVSVIYLCLLSPIGYSGLPSGSGEQPSNTGIHDLATPGTHSSGCCHPDWWALTSPSHPYLAWTGRLFSSAFSLPSPTPCILTSGMLFVARTFLILHKRASDRPSNCFHETKIVQGEQNAKLFFCRKNISGRTLSKPLMFYCRATA